jgi:hypothetical protein
MSVSAYPIGGRVWIVRTDVTADPTPPSILPASSIAIDADDAARLGAQILAAGVRVATTEPEAEWPGAWEHDT